MNPSTVFTIGHSKRSIEEFLGILVAQGVKQVIDVRRFPRSASNPQFNSEMLQAGLAAAGVGYVHFEALGGRRGKIAAVDPSRNAGWEEQAFHNFADYAGTQPFREAFEELLRLASEQPSAIMCAEAVWWRCHRRIITDHLLAHEVVVVHLGASSAPKPATMTPFAVVGPNFEVTYPGAPDLFGDPARA